MNQTRRAFVVAAAIAAGCPIRASSQKRVPRVGLLAPAAWGPNTNWFETALLSLGYVLGRDVILEQRSADGHLERLPALAAELVAIPVDVLVVAGPAPLKAAMAAASSIPIVMIASSSDPIGEGLVKSLARPGGNLTGTTYAVTPERFAKQLELLTQIAPLTKRVSVWWDFDEAIYHRSWKGPLEHAARVLKIDVLPPRPVFQKSGVVDGIAAMKTQGANAMLVAISGPTWPYATLVAEEATRQRIATVSAFKEFTQVGGLISYGPDFPALYQRGAGFVNRILKGARPAEMAIELPTKYELGVNVKTAKLLGLVVPNDLLIRADQVVR